MPNVAYTAASSGVNSALIAAPGAGKFIKVLGLTFSAAGTVTATFQDSTPVVLNKVSAVAGTAVDYAPNSNRQWNCTLNTSLDVSLSGAVSVTGSIYYEIVNTSP